jgi:hypothetical protein
MYEKLTLKHEYEIHRRANLRPRSHRRAEARRHRVRTLHRRQKRAVAALRIDRVPVAIVEQHPVLNADRGQVARADSEECETALRPRVAVEDAEMTTLPFRCEELDIGWVEILLPAMRPHRISEERAVLPALETIARGALFIRPAARQFAGTLDAIENDGAVAHGGPDDFVPAARQTLDEPPDLVHF